MAKVLFIVEASWIAEVLLMLVLSRLVRVVSDFSRRSCFDMSA